MNPTTIAPYDKHASKGDTPAFIVGDPSGKLVQNVKPITRQIFVNLSIRGDREFSTCRPLHEIPILRQLYSGGEVEIRTEWVPGISRVKNMTENDLNDEERRLSDAFTIIVENAKVCIPERIYGLGASSRLAKTIHDMWKAWAALEAEVRERVMPSVLKAAAISKESPKEWQVQLAINEALTVKDFEAIVAIANPMKGTLDGINLDGINLDDSAAPLDVEDELDDVVGDLSGLADHVMAAGFDENTAFEFAGVVAENPRSIPDKEWEKVPGVGTNAKKRSALLNSLNDFRNKKPDTIDAGG